MGDDLAERIVEAAGAVVFDHDGIIPADHAASRRCARAAIAAAVREAGLDAAHMRHEMLAVAAFCDGDARNARAVGATGYATAREAVAALLRALAGIADGQTANEKGRAQS